MLFDLILALQNNAIHSGVTVGGVFVFYKNVNRSGLNVYLIAYSSTCNAQWVCCVSKTNLKHILHIESAIHEMKIESTAAEMFWKEKNTIICAYITNI